MSDELEWVQRQAHPHFRARNHAGTGDYFVYVDKNWGTPILIASFSRDHRDARDDWQREEIYRGSATASFEPAITLAQEHHNAACRARRWADYMRDNEPPEETA